MEFILTARSGMSIIVPEGHGIMLLNVWYTDRKGLTKEALIYSIENGLVQ
jgi:hypothetical protein